MPSLHQIIVLDAVACPSFKNLCVPDMCPATIMSDIPIAPTEAVFSKQADGLPWGRTCNELVTGFY
jgi:hypothetical protein